MTSHAPITNWYHSCVELKPFINWSKFHMFWMNNKKVMLEGLNQPPPGCDTSKKPRLDRVKCALDNKSGGKHNWKQRAKEYHLLLKTYMYTGFLLKWLLSLQYSPSFKVLLSPFSALDTCSALRANFLVFFTLITWLKKCKIIRYSGADKPDGKPQICFKNLCQLLNNNWGFVVNLKFLLGCSQPNLVPNRAVFCCSKENIVPITMHAPRDICEPWIYIIFPWI